MTPRYIGIGTVFTLLLMLLACSGKNPERPAGQELPPVKGAQLETVQSVVIPEQLAAVGTVRAVTNATVSARIPGVIATLAVREGDSVKKGQVLLTLLAQEAASGAVGAVASVDEAARAVDEARSRLKLAESTFGRYEKLLAEQAVTRQEFDQRLHEREVASQGLARAEARLAQAQAGATAAKTVADYTRITAPIGGVVTRKQAELGATVFPGMPLLTIEEAGRYLLEVAAPESLLGTVRVGQRLAVAFDGQDGPHSGTVSEVVPLVDPATRTFTVKVAVAGIPLRSGQYGRGIFTVGYGRGISVPTTALVEKGGLQAVWTLDQSRIARLRIVKSGRSLGNRIEIISGLSDGDQVIVGGTKPTAEGARVE